MPGDTSATVDAGAEDLSMKTIYPVASTSYACNSCHISFDDSLQQRAHMKEPWHINNVKRRVESLQPTSLEDFKAENSQKDMAVKTLPTTRISHRKKDETFGEQEDDSSDDSAGSDRDSQWPFQCLFCNRDCSDNEDGLARNLEHMRSAHAFVIPNAEDVIDMLNFVSYLATEVRSWHECLYCGATKPSTASAQSHMRDKGHCRINLDREPELRGLWEASALSRDDHHIDEHSAGEMKAAPVINLSATDVHYLPSGRVISSKDATVAAKNPPRKQRPESTALPTSAEPSSEPSPSDLLLLQPNSSARQISRREDMSIAGLTPQQRLALVSAEKKAQRSEDVARRAREWVYARGANSQKHDQLNGSGKWGKQQHHLLPR